jgi:drug/metabolite transporter (DMT)-like permease
MTQSQGLPLNTSRTEYQNREHTAGLLNGDDERLLTEDDYLDYDLNINNGNIKSGELSQKLRYMLASFALLVCLITFVVQTEAAGYLATTLNYKKPIFMLYVTHSSWTLLWPLQIFILRIRKRYLPFKTFFRLHLDNVLSTAQMIVDINKEKSEGVMHHHRKPSRGAVQGFHSPYRDGSPLIATLKVCLILFFALTIAGSSWYIAINLTTTSDITAIYNCSAFFAYTFSVPLLREAFKWDKAISVILAMAGVFIVAYGGESEDNDSSKYPYRLSGNLVIGVGAVLYGLYEVLYKRLACPPSTVSPRRQAAFANVVGSGIGLCTLSILWIILPVLHFTGVETFELPRGEILWLLILSVVTNMLFSGGMLVLMSLTSPVLSSVASLLTIFIVAVVDWLFLSTPILLAGMVGGVFILIAFVMLSVATWRELVAEEEEGQEVENEYRERELLRDEGL